MIDHNETITTDNAALEGIRQELNELKDLFVRRLMNDKQKAGLLQTVTDAAQYAFIEPFLNDIILLLDRLCRTEGELSESVIGELLEILGRRGVELIEVPAVFDPVTCRALKSEESETLAPKTVVEVLRNGYTFNGKVLRPADVVVSTAKKQTTNGATPECVDRNT